MRLHYHTKQGKIRILFCSVNRRGIGNMVHIFSALERQKEQIEAVSDGKLKRGNKSAVSEYILSRLVLVCDEIRVTDVDAIGYLEVLYNRVLEDPRIASTERSLLDVLDKMEEDLMFDCSVFGERATFILNFLEADLLRSAADKTRNDNEKRILGRIQIIRSLFLEENKKDYDEHKGASKPAQIKAYLDEHVIGQEVAKKAISLAVYGHDKRVKHPDIKFASNVVLLIGPSGCGKTEIMRRIQEITDYPMIFTDVSSLGASQYRGRHKEDILISLWEQAGRKKALAENGIIFMDEFDKLLLPAISEKGINMHDDVQSQLLTMLEGSDVELKVNGQNLVLNTSHMLFILAGAFQGIEEYIRNDQKRRKQIAGNIGFLSPLEKEMDLDFVRENISHEVLMAYGMKRELAGRISAIAVLERLQRKDMIRILTEPRESIICRYEKEFQLSCGADLEFTEYALEAIADLALKEPIGARALQPIVRKALRDALFCAPQRSKGGHVIVDREVILEGKLPIFEEADERTGEWNEENL